MSDDEKRFYQRKLTKQGNYTLQKIASSAGIKNMAEFHNAGYKGLYNGETADVISINATCNEDNKGMITKEQLLLKKENAILVNTARAELINKGDLFDFISNRKSNCLAMDGFYEEPLEDKENKYLKISDDRFLITSHNAYNSNDALYEMEKMLIESLEDIVENKEIIRNIVRWVKSMNNNEGCHKTSINSLITIYCNP